MSEEVNKHMKNESLTTTGPLIACDPKTGFWRSLLVEIRRPNINNRRLMGCQLVNCWRSDGSVEDIMTHIKELTSDQISDRLRHCQRLSDEELNSIETIDGIVVIVRQLFAKSCLKDLCSSVDTRLTDTVLCDIHNCRTIFVNNSSNSDEQKSNTTHEFYLGKDSDIHLKSFDENASNQWLSHKVLPKLRQWMAHEMVYIHRKLFHRKLLFLRIESI